MVILNIASSLSRGGVERDQLYLSSELARMGHTVHLAYIYNGPKGELVHEELVKGNVVLHHLTARNSYDPTLIWQLVRLIRRIKPDIIHTWQLQVDILGWLAARFTRKPCILREPSCAAGHPNTWKERLRLRAGANIGGVVSNSAGGDEYWRSCSPRSIRYIVSNGYPLDRITGTPPASPKDVVLPPDQKYLLYAGRLVPGKGLENLIRAFAKVASELPLTLVFCGDGPLKKSLEKQAQETRMTNRIRFTGFVPNERVWAFMKSAEALVFQSEFEGQPNVVLEAMACKCPLVVSDIPAHREFLDETTAFFTDLCDPAKIAAAIRQLLAEPQRTRAKVEIAWNTVQNYSLPKEAQAYERIYKEVIFRREKRLREHL